uniref:Uncharacterized protein n=1 Tax=Lactuca sativa TaxID=4236 RepID=A0A9R1XKW5_LACSA|nr:hypothetical protein LSAT_V11C300125590 [Lactuca sativa]
MGLLRGLSTSTSHAWTRMSVMRSWHDAKEWLDEDNEEVLDNIEEQVRGPKEVIHDAEKVDPFDTGDDDEVEDEDEDGDEDEDENGRRHFIKKDKGTQSDIGTNLRIFETVDEDMDDNEDVDPDLPKNFNEHLH